MGKTSKVGKSLTDQEIIFTKYKWEFLRRNPEYIDDWNKLQSDLEEKYGDWRPPGGRVTPQEIEFFMKWRIAYPMDPYLSYDQLTSGRKKGFFVLSRSMHEWFYSEFLRERPVVATGVWNYEVEGNREIDGNFVETGKLTVEVDLNYSKKRLGEEFKTLLDRMKTLYEKKHKQFLLRMFCKERGLKPGALSKQDKDAFTRFYKQEMKKRRDAYEKKYHVVLFDKYLQVYDLRKKRVSWSNIVTSMGLNSIQDARNAYASAKEIIKKGVDPYIGNHEEI